MTDLQRALRRLINHGNVRWRYLGYGHLTCTCCGARANEDEELGTTAREDPCSPHCPWAAIEQYLEESHD